MDAEDLKDDVPDKWASSLSDEVLLQALEDTNYPQICDISSVAVGVQSSSAWESGPKYRFCRSMILSTSWCIAWRCWARSYC